MVVFVCVSHFVFAFHFERILTPVSCGIILLGHRLVCVWNQRMLEKVKADPREAQAKPASFSPPLARMNFHLDAQRQPTNLQLHNWGLSKCPDKAGSCVTYEQTVGLCHPRMPLFRDPSGQPRATSDWSLPTYAAHPVSVYLFRYTRHVLCLSCKTCVWHRG